MNLILTLFKLIRIETSIISALISGAICYRINSMDNALFVFACTFFTITYGFTINEVVDFEKDKIQPNDHVIASNFLNQKQAVIISIFLFLCSLICTCYLSFFQIILNLLVLVILSLYSFINNRQGIIANGLVAACSAISILIAQKQFELNIITISSLSVFFFIFSREIILDIHDIKADSSINKKSLPIIFDINKSFSISIVLSLFSLINCIVLGIVYNKWLYIILAMIAHLLYLNYLSGYKKDKGLDAYEEFINYSRLSFLIIIPALLIEI